MLKLQLYCKDQFNSYVAEVSNFCKVTPKYLTHVKSTTLLQGSIQLVTGLFSFLFFSFSCLVALWDRVNGWSYKSKACHSRVSLQSILFLGYWQNPHVTNIPPKKKEEKKNTTKIPCQQTAIQPQELTQTEAHALLTVLTAGARDHRPSISVTPSLTYRLNQSRLIKTNLFIHPSRIVISQTVSRRISKARVRARLY